MKVVTKYPSGMSTHATVSIKARLSAGLQLYNVPCLSMFRSKLQENYPTSFPFMFLRTQSDHRLSES